MVNSFIHHTTAETVTGSAAAPIVLPSYQDPIHSLGIFPSEHQEEVSNLNNPEVEPISAASILAPKVVSSSVEANLEPELVLSAYTFVLPSGSPSLITDSSTVLIVYPTVTAPYQLFQ